jgi:biopolymer transport protein ExbD
MAKRSSEEVSVNMTPMIDIVFQLIIFFVVTAKLDSDAFEQSIMLAFSPHGPGIETKDPRTVNVEVDEKGRIMISRSRISDDLLAAVLKQAVSRGGASTPVMIRADRNADHEYVRKVMDACGKAGIWKVSFVALKEAGEGGS